MIYKNGNIEKQNFYESDAMNLFKGRQYTSKNPYVLTGTTKDINLSIDNYCQVTPGKTYYYLAKCDTEWSDKHGYFEDTKGKATMWLYLCKVYDENNRGYDKPIRFMSKNMIADGVWEYTIPDGYNMARVRVNTYSDGTDTVTVKFWDMKLIPAEYYVNSSLSLHFMLERIISHQERVWRSKSSKGGGLV